ncbi:uncharacterized protein STEHIDRAFT_162516 [Stereum hirsutum FP-91666 SS1]|uniref:uncharacterized protein n=1 Tax=Stereum hirsutum (strain FP-91666) TaxID=721885 RepID=UPI000444A501|nr:uncharacterized protein STEHIDRAFT_162516 [Stereum hirsutum FP-91666 SS1]EIM80737.1 hypothetical protein STEHIDRAFT_162516 [Stereum hirsutum FP-91666 SS1]
MSSPQSFAGATATLLTGASPPNVCGHRPNVPMTDLTSILTSTSASSPQSTTSSPPTMASGFKVVAGSRCTIDPLDPNHKLFKTPGPLANGAPHIAQIIRSNSYPSVPLHPHAPKPVIPSENAKSGSRFVERLTDSHPANPHTDAELARIVSEGVSIQSRPQVQDRRLMGLIRKRSTAMVETRSVLGRGRMSLSARAGCLVNLISTLLSSPQTPGPVPSSGSSCLSPPAVSPPSPPPDSLRSEISSIWPPAPSSYAEFGVLVPTAWDLDLASRTPPTNTRMQDDTDTQASVDSSETKSECGDLVCMWTIVDGRHVGSTPPITSTSRFVECIPDCGYDDMLGYADDVRFGCIKDLDLYDLISCEYQDEEVDETKAETLEEILTSMFEDRPRDRRAKMLPVRLIRMLSR